MSTFSFVTKNFTEENIVWDSEEVAFISSFFRFPAPLSFKPRLPKQPKKSQLGQQSIGCDEGPPTNAIFETRTFRELYSIVSMERVIRNVKNSGDFYSFGNQVKRSSTVAGKSKVEIEISAAKKEPGTKQTGVVKSGGTAEAKNKSPENKKLKVKASNKSNVNDEASAKIKSKTTDLKAGTETGVEKELQATEKELKATQKELKATQKELKATEKDLKATEESNSREKAKATEESDSRKKAKATGKSDANEESKTTEETESRKKAKATKLSDSREKAKATKKSDSRKKSPEDSSAKQKLKATGKSGSEKEARVIVDESEVRNGTGNQEEKESSRPGSKNVRTCMTCGLQEPAPKIFKKCKRCKDEDCLNPPYYCGRDCQVLDWTARHRQEHEKSLGA